MSVEPNHVYPKDPNAQLVHTFDWTLWLVGVAQIASSTMTVSEGGDAELTVDQDSVLAGNKMTQVRVNGGTAGRKYRVTNQVVTNETPPQKDERSFFVLIENQ